MSTLTQAYLRRIPGMIEYPGIPFVSLILPVYNEEMFIERCLRAILAQDYPADKVEILVVDGRSTDATRDIVCRLQSEHPAIRLLDNPERLQAHGLNYGIKIAHGDIVIRVDGHTLLESDYVSQCVRLLREMAQENVVNVGGPMRPQGVTLAGRAIAAATSSPFGIPTAFHHSSRAQFVDTVYLGAWPRAVFEQLGGFNPQVNVNEDYEFNYRIRRAGGKLYFSPEIRSTYYCRQSFPALWRQYHRYGIQKAKMLRRYPASIRLRQLVPPLFALALPGGLLLGLLWQEFWWAWLAMVGIYLAAAVLAASRTRREQVSLAMVVIAFAIIHIAWGMGFWRGWVIILASILRQLRLSPQ